MPRRAAFPPPLAQGIDAVLDLADIVEQHMRVLGGDEPAGGALEQRKAEQCFGMAQRLRDRGLRNIEHARRAAHRAGGVNCVKNLDMAQLHRAGAPGARAVSGLASASSVAKQAMPARRARSIQGPEWRL